MLRSKSLGNRIVDYTNNTLLLLIASLAVIPFLYIFAGSFTSTEELLKRGFILIPTKWSLEAYEYVFSTPTIPRSMLNSVLITVVGTFINISLSTTMGYALARKDLVGRRGFMLMVLFAMLFNGGMIPTFLVVKGLGLTNSYWSVILPGAINAFYLTVMKNFFQQIPEGLEEAATIDGCNDLGIFFRIVLPLSKSAIATFVLFYAVAHWNSFFNAILYINESSKWPVQVWLRQIVILSAGGFVESSDDSIMPPPQSIKMAVIMVSTTPILVVYPFLQKHFAKGVLVGSIKG